MSYKIMTRYFLLFLAFSAIAVACDSDTSEKTAQAIEGKWELFAAKTNGKSTNRLEGTFFDFRGDTMESSFPIVPKIPYTTEIEISKNAITDLTHNIKFNIAPSSEKDTLNLSTTVDYKGTPLDFELRLLRK